MATLLLESMEVCIHVEFPLVSVHQDFPVCLAEVGGGLHKAVAGIVPTYSQHVSHGVPEL